MSWKVKYRSCLFRSTWSMASLSGLRRARPSTTSKAKLKVSAFLNAIFCREPSSPSWTVINFSQIWGSCRSGAARRSSFFSLAGTGMASSGPLRTMA